MSPAPGASAPTASPAPVAEGSDRSGLLTLFGVAEILIGVLCAGFAGLLAVAIPMASRLPAGRAGSLQGSSLLASALFYGVAAVFFAVVGVGTMRARRWARAIMLIVSWPWLLSVVLGVAMLGSVLRPLLAGIDTGGEGPAPPGAMLAVLVVVGGVMALLPLAFILFYSGRNVRWTFATRDPRPCWTDGRPLSVLAVALVMFLSAAAALSGLRYRVLPIFGWMLTGWPAVVAIVALCGLCAWLGRELYRMTMRGFRANLAFAVLTHLSWGVTLSRIGYEGVLRALQFDDARINLMHQTGFAALLASPWSVAVSLAAWIAALLSIRGHLAPGPAATRVDPP